MTAARSRSKVRFALIGAGAIADVHANAITSLREAAELSLVVSTRDATARRLAEASGAGGYTTDFDAVLADPDIDALSISTPTGTHAELAVPALEAGKHVMIEKPIDVSLEAADRVIVAETASGRKVGVVSQHRFDRATERVMTAIAGGAFGRLTSGAASCPWWRPQSYYDSGRWRGTWEMDGGGAIINQTIHVIDLLIAMMGVPTEVFAYAGRLAHERIEVEDTAVAVVRFAGGALGMIHGTTAAYPGLDAGVRVYGTNGSAVISGDELVYFHADAGDAPALSRPTPSPDERRLGLAHVAQFADFVDAIQSDRPVRVGAADGRAALAVVLALYESAAAGKPVPVDR